MPKEAFRLLEEKIQRLCCELEHNYFMPLEHRKTLLAELEILKAQMENVKKVLNAKKDN